LPAFFHGEAAHQESEENALTEIFRKLQKTMAYRQSTNPAMREGAFRTLSGSGSRDIMTTQGSLNKAGILLLLIALAAAFSWAFPHADLAALGTKLAIFTVVGLILALVTMFKPDWSPYTAPAYAVAEGLVLGSFSRLMELTYSGIVMQAVSLTLAISFAMWALYRFRLIQVTDRFRTIVTAATLGIFLVYLVSGLMSLFGGSGLGLVHGATPMGIVFSLIVVGEGPSHERCRHSTDTPRYVQRLEQFPF
jgi:uncharacterized YccA/Bax inhibitor family protein